MFYVNGRKGWSYVNNLYHNVLNQKAVLMVYRLMRKFSILMLAAVICLSAWSLVAPDRLAFAAATDPRPQVSPFEQAVEIIKKYETMHTPRHWPFVGYGHKVLPGEKFNRNKTLSEKEADALLRKDLLKNCAVFRQFGADSLLLGVLAYNIGSGATMRSPVVKKLKAGDRDIRASYLAHCRYKGKEHAQIKRRRIEEFETLFIKKLPEKNNSRNLAFSKTPVVSARQLAVNRQRANNNRKSR